MQERYLGDIHDFYKFLFLKYLSKQLNKKIGLNWFLVNPSEISFDESKKNDGEKRNYLKKSEIYSFDKKISEEFRVKLNKKNRKIENFTNDTHLKKYVKFYNKKISLKKRELWFTESLEFFKNEEIIFLDPDNGILKTKKKKNSLKHLHTDEAAKYLSADKIIIFTQFQSYSQSHIKYLKEIKVFLKSKNLEIFLPIIRNRSGPNTFFITLGNKCIIEQKCLLNIYENYGKKYKEKIELITL